MDADNTIGGAEMTADELGVIYDQSDSETIAAHSWWLNTGGYACTKIRRGEKRATVLMHRMIYGDVPPGMMIDHINRNRLDNRKINLRAVTPSQNSANRTKVRNASSTHKGVSKNGDRWQVVVRIDGSLKWIGSYESEVEAAAVAAPYFDSPNHAPEKHGVTGDRCSD